MHCLGGALGRGGCGSASKGREACGPLLYQPLDLLPEPGQPTTDRVLCSILYMQVSSLLFRPPWPHELLVSALCNFELRVTHFLLLPPTNIVVVVCKAIAVCVLAVRQPTR